MQVNVKHALPGVRTDVGDEPPATLEGLADLDTRGRSDPMALLRAQDEVEKLQKKLTGDILTGARILLRALEEPTRQIILNTGAEEAAVIVRELRETAREGGRAAVDTVRAVGDGAAEIAGALAVPVGTVKSRVFSRLVAKKEAICWSRLPSRSV